MQIQITIPANELEFIQEFKSDLRLISKGFDDILMEEIVTVEFRISNSVELYLMGQYVQSSKDLCSMYKTYKKSNQ